MKKILIISLVGVLLILGIVAAHFYHEPYYPKAKPKAQLSSMKLTKSQLLEEKYTPSEDPIGPIETSFVSVSSPRDYEPKAKIEEAVVAGPSAGVSSSSEPMFPASNFSGQGYNQGSGYGGFSDQDYGQGSNYSAPSASYSESNDGYFPSYPQSSSGYTPSGSSSRSASQPNYIEPVSYPAAPEAEKQYQSNNYPRSSRKARPSGQYVPSGEKLSQKGSVDLEIPKDTPVIAPEVEADSMLTMGAKAVGGVAATKITDNVFRYFWNKAKDKWYGKKEIKPKPEAKVDDEDYEEADYEDEDDDEEKLDQEPKAFDRAAAAAAPFGGIAADFRARAAGGSGAGPAGSSSAVAAVSSGSGVASVSSSSAATATMSGAKSGMLGQTKVLRMPSLSSKVPTELIEGPSSGLTRVLRMVPASPKAPAELPAAPIVPGAVGVITPLPITPEASRPAVVSGWYDNLRKQVSSYSPYEQLLAVTKVLEYGLRFGIPAHVGYKAITSAPQTGSGDGLVEVFSGYKPEPSIDLVPRAEQGVIARPSWLPSYLPAGWISSTKGIAEAFRSVRIR